MHIKSVAGRKPRNRNVVKSGSKSGSDTYTPPTGGGGTTATINVNGKTVNFGHGGRHLEGTGLDVNTVIGLATELLWMYEDISDSRRLTISTHQLEVDPSPSQSLGFYLTPNSPMLVFKVNSLTEREDEIIEYKNWKEISIRKKCKSIL